MAKNIKTGIEIYAGNLFLHKINQGESRAIVAVRADELNEYIAMVQERLKTEFSIFTTCDKDLKRIENYTDIFLIDGEENAIKLREGVKKSHLTENFYSSLNPNMQYAFRVVNEVLKKSQTADQ